MELYRIYTFEAAHGLTRVPSDHPCRQMHGHRFQVTIRVEGQVAADLGWVMDFSSIDAVVRPLMAILDHSCLNDVDGLSNPTSECIAMWLWARLVDELDGMVVIEVAESPEAGCIYRGDDEVSQS